MNLSPSDRILDTQEIRQQLAAAVYLTAGPGSRSGFDWVAEGPLPTAAIVVRDTTTDEAIATASEPDATQLRDARAVAQTLIRSGYAYSAVTASKEPAGDDWPLLLQHARETLAALSTLEANGPWKRAATYVLDRCQAALAGPGPDETMRAGAYGILRYIATFGHDRLGFQSHWQLRVPTDD